MKHLCTWPATASIPIRASERDAHAALCAPRRPEEPQTDVYSPECVERLSEKGSERGSEGGFGRYEENDTGRKEPSRRSLGLRRGSFLGVSDGLSTHLGE